MQIDDAAQARAVRRWPGPAEAVPATEPVGNVPATEPVENVPATEPVAVEQPVALEFNGVSHAVMLASPADLEDFAVGFALTEGIVDSLAQVHGIEAVQGPQGITVRIDVASSCFARLKERRRQLSGRSGCGLCGIDSLQQVMGPAQRVPPSGLRVAPRVLLQAAAALRGQQPLMAATGATHAAAWADAQGRLLLVREDIGRHNALDKLIGALLRLRQGGVAQQGLVLMSSRAGYELVHKAACAGIGLLAALSGPTSLAIDRAQACGITLASFVRDGQLSVHHDAGHLDWTSTDLDGASPWTPTT